MQPETRLYGPFSQVVTFAGAAPQGPLDDAKAAIIDDGAVVVSDGLFVAVGKYKDLIEQFAQATRCPEPSRGVLFPGMVDAHTHLCWAGSRADEYAMRLDGETYQTIAQKGGGIQKTVRAVRAAEEEELLLNTLHRLNEHLFRGVTTCEIKSGYGLNIDDEMKMLSVIAKAAAMQPIDLIPTCLAAHVIPLEYESDGERWLHIIEQELWPLMRSQKLSHRVDIFVEDGAYSPREARDYLKRAIQYGLDVTIHANQFSSGGAALAATVGARSADHLEVINNDEIAALAQADVAAIVLPGATLGLGMPFPAARRMLDGGLKLVIASDWNPGTAPMGDLLTGAALLSCQQKLTMAETWSAITFRAAAALGLKDRGSIEPGKKADMLHYCCKDWRDVLYYQGSLKPHHVIIGGEVHYRCH